MGRGCWQRNGELTAFGSAAIKLQVEPEQFNGAQRSGSEMLVVVCGAATHITSERVNRKCVSRTLHECVRWHSAYFK
jgi:hypothetical protein